MKVFLDHLFLATGEPISDMGLSGDGEIADEGSGEIQDNETDDIYAADMPVDSEGTASYLFLYIFYLTIPAIPS